MIIEFVGPSAVGKSTISEEVARLLTEQNIKAWVEPEFMSVWSQMKMKDILSSIRYARTLGIKWTDGFANEVIDISVAQAKLRQYSYLEGVVLSQGVARDLWISCRRHNVSDTQRAQAIGNLELPNGVILLNAGDEVREHANKSLI